VVQQPLLKFQDRVVEGGEAFLLIVRDNPFRRDKGSNKKSLMDIYATANWVNDFHTTASLKNNAETAVTGLPHI
jgi:hypothetical protein